MPFITPESFYMIHHDNPLYIHFRMSTDRETGRELLDNVFEKFSLAYGGTRAGAELSAATLQEMIGAVDHVLPIEHRKSVTNKRHIDRLQQRAMSGYFFEKLLGPQYRHDRMRYNRVIHNRENESAAFRRDAEIGDVHLAVKWVLGRSQTLSGAQTSAAANAAVAQTLEAAIWNVARHRDVTDLNTLDFLHTGVGIQQGNKRTVLSNIRNEFYGGVALGRFLQRYTMRHARALRGAVTAYDLSMFLMVSLIVAHGYTDGNGRACRALLAATQIKARVPFFAPSKPWAQSLIHDQAFVPSSPDVLEREMHARIDDLI